MAETDTTATSRNVQYPNEEFQSIYDSILASMGDDDTLRANLEAALRPMYEQSLAQLQQQRLAGNAAIDVDAYSRGMGNSSWVTDAKLQNLRNAESNIASLNANYNNTLFTNLMNAIADRDNKAYNQAMTFWQYDQAKKGGGGPSGPAVIPNTASYDDWLKAQQGVGNVYDKILAGIQAGKANGVLGNAGAATANAAAAAANAVQNAFSAFGKTNMTK
ncbi:MAG: hypothetical protein II452_00475 [Paludibacteraceae bacterium]|nr:hypothetical protein [Paludibacteraceae bacterium]